MEWSGSKLCLNILHKHFHLQKRFAAFFRDLKTKLNKQRQTTEETTEARVYFLAQSHFHVMGQDRPVI